MSSETKEDSETTDAGDGESRVTTPNRAATPNQASNQGRATSAIRAVDLSKRYLDGEQRVFAVRQISMGIDAQEWVALAGPSGSGKTTLLGLLGAMIAPSSGDVELFGESTVHLRDRHRTELRRAHVGFVFQELALVGDMTLLENILLPLVPSGGATRADRERAMVLLTRFGLDERVQTPAARLSGGQRQRGAIARALIRDPRILLLDEPTAHLDAENVATLLGELATLKSEGRTIVCTTHDPRLMEFTGLDRVVRMQDGQVRPD